MLEGVESTSRQTTRIVQDIKRLMMSQKQKIRNELPKIYSQDLLNNIFKHPYTKIDFFMDDLKISRNTAIKYLNELVNIDILSKEIMWRDNYFINKDLLKLLLNVSEKYPL
jgi:Fic family protein